MGASEDRAKFVSEYKSILGRNKYSQNLRSYVFTKYKDGNFYSDCSSSIAKCYERIGLPITYSGSKLPNTAGMMRSNDLTDVPVIIKNGIIQNPEVLRVGDLLLFAGNDRARSYVGYVGHVEAVYAIDGKKITICGHGSNKPRTTEMNAYCKSRYATKADTPLKNRGLIRVRRRIADDAPQTELVPIKAVEVRTVGREIEVTGNTVNLRAGAGKESRVVDVVRKGERLERIEACNGFVPVLHGGTLCWIAEMYVREV